MSFISKRFFNFKGHQKWILGLSIILNLVSFLASAQQGEIPLTPAEVERIKIKLPPLPPDLPIEIVEAPIGQIYTPLGFDDNDISQFVIEGVFPDNCYRITPAIVDIDSGNHHIRFDIFAYKYKGPCPENTRTAWMQVVDVGVLTKGLYTLIHQSKTQLDFPSQEVGKLNISHTTSLRRDDFVYAPVDSILLKTPRDFSRTLTIMGTFSDNCTKIDLEKTRINQNDNVVVVQPVTKRDENRNGCQPIPTAFMEDLRIPKKIQQARYLFHIRSMDGNSFNKIAWLSGGD